MSAQIAPYPQNLPLNPPRPASPTPPLPVSSSSSTGTEPGASSPFPSTPPRASTQALRPPRPSAAAVDCMTPELLARLLHVLQSDEECMKNFLGREEELLSAASSSLLAEKELVGKLDTVANLPTPYAQDVGSMTTFVERCQLPQTYTPEERAMLNRGHEYVAKFQNHQKLQKFGMGHRLATADYCDTGQEVLARAKWEVRATPLELVAYWMGTATVYAARQEHGRSKTIQLGVRR